MIEAASPSLHETAPVRVSLRRRVLRRAAWLTLDLGAVAICAAVFLKALT